MIYKDLLNCVQATSRNAYVQQDNVWLHGRSNPVRVLRAGALADESKTTYLGQASCNSLAKQRMVINNRNANLLFQVVPRSTD